MYAKGIQMETDVNIMPDLFKTALYYGKKYLTNQIGSILRVWSLDDVVEENFPFQDN